MNPYAWINQLTPTHTQGYKAGALNMAANQRNLKDWVDLQGQQVS